MFLRQKKYFSCIRNCLSSLLLWRISNALYIFVQKILIQLYSTKLFKSCFQPTKMRLDSGNDRLFLRVPSTKVVNKCNGNVLTAIRVFFNLFFSFFLCISCAYNCKKSPNKENVDVEVL